MKKDYIPPVSFLLNYGDARNSFKSWPNYLDLGLTEDHIPDLIQLATDDEIYLNDEDELYIWAPIHAWRALAQLQAYEAADPLLEQLFRIDEEDNDWINEEYPVVFEMFGPQAIPSLETYLKTTDHDLFAKVCAANCLEKIGNRHKESRSDCIRILTEVLQNHKHNEPEYNGLLVSFLIDLKAAESIKVIQEAFMADDVDLTIAGDLEDVEIALGIRLRRATPPPKFELVKDSPLPRMIPLVKAEAKIGRNDPCPCGSGKKYKKCCLNQ